jgi:hypothetical protein
MTTTTAFEVGKSYGTRSVCDYDCIFVMTVVKRTEKTLWIERHGKVERKRITVWDGVESVSMGSYSMAASWYADRDENGDRIAQEPAQVAQEAAPTPVANVVSLDAFRARKAAQVQPRNPAVAALAEAIAARVLDVLTDANARRPGEQ